MAVKIRLMRIGTKKRPFYRVVAIDERQKRSGAYLDLLGTYNPLTEPKEILLNQVKIDAWVKNGAVFSDGFLRIIGKAPQRPPRKTKRDKGKKATILAPETAKESPEPAINESIVEEPGTEKNIAEVLPVETPTEVELSTGEEK